MRTLACVVACVSLALLYPTVGNPAEPKYRIRLLSGSEVNADRAWIQGDRLLYERSGFTGNVRLVDVKALYDKEADETAASCLQRLEDGKRQLQATSQAAEEMRRRYPDAKSQAMINSIQQRETDKELLRIEQGCAAAIEKYNRNKRVFDEARERARKQ